jgi:hypothetical protein
MVHEVQKFIAAVRYTSPTLPLCLELNDSLLFSCSLVNIVYLVHKISLFILNMGRLFEILNDSAHIKIQLSVSFNHILARNENMNMDWVIWPLPLWQN